MYRTFHIKDINTHEDDNIYYNVIIDHSNYGSTGPYTNPEIIPPITYHPVNGTFTVLKSQTELATYTTTRDVDILEKASDYYASIVRFAIPLDEVPVMVMEIIPNQKVLGINPPDPNLTPYVIGIQYNNNSYPTQLIYISRNDYPAPEQYQPEQVITPYYFVYSYNQFIEMVNDALQQSYIAAGLLTAYPGYIPPYFEYSPDGICSIIAPAIFNSPSVAAPRIYMNSALESFFSPIMSQNTMPVNINQNPISKKYGDDYFIIFGPTNALGSILSQVKPYYPLGITPPPLPAYTSPVVPRPPIAADYYSIQFEYNTIPLWNSLRKIVITSNLMPIRSEGIPSLNSNNPGLASGLPIFSDFVPNLDFAGDSRSIAYYNPTGQYKLVDLVSDLPLRRIDLQIYWQDRNQNLYPISLSLFQSASIKIGFFRKNIYKKFREKVEGQSF